MKALIDTHVFLWWNMNDPQLSDVARAFIADGSNELFFSAASAWEIAIKTSIGRLTLPETAEKYISSRLTLQHIQALPIQVSHAVRVAALENLHKDPFDRLLIAQSQLEKIPLLTADPKLAPYDVEIIW